MADSTEGTLKSAPWFHVFWSKNICLTQCLVVTTMTPIVWLTVVRPTQYLV